MIYQFVTGTAYADSIYNNAASVTISAGDGKDVIYGFGDDDLLEITGLTGAVAGTFNSSGNELTVKVGSTAVAVFKDFTASTFNVNLNGNSHTIKKENLRGTKIFFLPSIWRDFFYGLQLRDFGRKH